MQVHHTGKPSQFCRHNSDDSTGDPPMPIDNIHAASRSPKRCKRHRKQHGYDPNHAKASRFSIHGAGSCKGFKSSRRVSRSYNFDSFNIQKSVQTRLSGANNCHINAGSYKSSGMVKEKGLIRVVQRSRKSRNTKKNPRISRVSHETSVPDPVTCQGATTLGIVRSWRQLAKVDLQWAVVIATAVILIRVGRQHGEGLRSLDL